MIAPQAEPHHIAQPLNRHGCASALGGAIPELPVAVVAPAGDSPVELDSTGEYRACNDRPAHHRDSLIGRRRSIAHGGLRGHGKTAGAIPDMIGGIAVAIGAAVAPCPSPGAGNAVIDRHRVAIEGAGNHARRCVHMDCGCRCGRGSWRRCCRIGWSGCRGHQRQAEASSSGTPATVSAGGQSRHQGGNQGGAQRRRHVRSFMGHVFSSSLVNLPGKSRNRSPRGRPSNGGCHDAPALPKEGSFFFLLAGIPQVPWR